MGVLRFPCSRSRTQVAPRRPPAGRKTCFKQPNWIESSPNDTKSNDPRAISATSSSEQGGQIPGTLFGDGGMLQAGFDQRQFHGVLVDPLEVLLQVRPQTGRDRKSTRLNSS